MSAKIVHVNTARGYRGGERQTELLIRGLASHGVRQALVTRRGAPLATRLRDVDIDVREVTGGPAVGGARDAATRPCSTSTKAAVSTRHFCARCCPERPTSSRAASTIRFVSIGSRTRRIAGPRALPPWRRKWRRSFAPTTPRSECASSTAGAARCPSTRPEAPRSGRRSRASSSSATWARSTTAKRARSSSSPLRASSRALIPTCTSCWSAAARTKRCSGRRPQASRTSSSRASWRTSATTSRLSTSSYCRRIAKASAAFCSTRWSRGCPSSRAASAAFPTSCITRRTACSSTPRARRSCATRSCTSRRTRTCARRMAARGREFAKDFTGEAMWRKYLALYESVLGRLV